MLYISAIFREPLADPTGFSFRRHLFERRLDACQLRLGPLWRPWKHGNPRQNHGIYRGFSMDFPMFYLWQPWMLRFFRIRKWVLGLYLNLSFLRCSGIDFDPVAIIKWPFHLVSGPLPPVFDKGGSLIIQWPFEVPFLYKPLGDLKKFMVSLLK